MKKIYNITIIILVVLILMLLDNANKNNNIIVELENTNENLSIELSQLKEEYEIANQYISTLEKYKKIYDGFESINIHTDTRYYDIPLTFEQQEFVQYVAEENGFAETFIYALMQGESNFNVDAVSYNQTSYGIMQINKNYVESASKLAGLEEYDIMDFYDNVRMGIAILRYNRDYYINKGYDSQEDLTHLTLSAYNRGIWGLRNHMQLNKTPVSAYSEKVLNNKMEIEQSLSNNE